MIKNLIISALFLSVVLLVYFYSKETPESYYPTLEDAKKNGAVKRGWIPPVLPLSAREIHEKHDLDTNRTWIKFNAAPLDLKNLSEQLRILTPQEIENLFPFEHPKNWWEPTNKNRHHFSIAAYDYQFKWADGRIDNKTGYFFLDIKNAIAYYYSP